MPKILDHEKRPWIINKAIIVPTRKRKGKCKARKCGKILSAYNLDPYCHVHKYLLVEEEDQVKRDQYVKQLTYYREKARRDAKIRK